ncbi:hypothetical protein BHU09_03640 [Tannerella sp. oral taxon 808]|nr:hypothetical protein BHU09_03640 [Tannerella sp. oral taxon 808]
MDIKTTIPPPFTPSYVPYMYKGENVKGAFGAGTRPDFIRASDRAYFDAGITRDDLRQLFIAMDLFDTGAGMKLVGDFNYGNIKARPGQSSRAAFDKVEKSNDGYANYASHADFARAKLRLIQKPLWRVNLEADSPSDIIDKIVGNPANAWGTLLSDAARRALETGKGIEQLSPTIGRYEGERDRVMRYRAQGIFDISRARQKMYAEKLTPIARQVGQYMAGGDPNVVYTPAFERTATPVEPPVVPPIRPMDPSAPTVPEQPTLAQGPTPISAEAFDKTAFTRKSRARLVDGRTVYVAAVDFERRQVKYYNGKDVPYWIDRDKVAAIV